MTYREIDVALKNIDIRKHNELACNVNLHGGKMSFKQHKKLKEDIKIDQKLVDAALKERFGDKWKAR